RMFSRAGPSRSWAFGLVPIRDQNGAPVEAASVHTEWTFPNGATHAQTRMTAASGWSLFLMPAPLTGEYELCVTDVSKTGYVYDSDQNVETCETIVVP
ncbi:MAG: hypothetical protein OEV76_09620, partial [Anaerolineae bacterium]|nr:hypothetical protein [Anaerolineae bacterium]